MSVKEQFIREYNLAIKNFGEVSKMVVAVKLPTGATELIINTEDLENKFNYYLNAYDENMSLKTNSNVKIVGILCV